MRDPETRETVSTGIAPVDERAGGLEAGGVYLLTGAPGPARLVAAVQFIEAGLRQGERCLLLASGDLRSTLDLARAWGFDLEPAWREGSLTLLGFQDDFEMRALRSVEPSRVLYELERLAGECPSRIAVHPGGLFLGRDTRNLLGRSFLAWAREQPATVCVTLPGEEPDGAGSSADWIFQEVTGRLVFSRRGPRLFQIAMERNAPLDGRIAEAITVELRPEQGLVVPEEFPQRRREDRPGLDDERILVVVLDDEIPADLAAWARGSFTADIVRGPLEAVARMNGRSRHGGVVLYGGRATIGEVTRAVRAIRPLTRAALLFASDDAVRSSDRIRLLESGADDCLTGGLNFQELGVRLRQAMATTRRGTPEARGRDESRAPATVGGPVDRQTLAWEARRRAAEPDEAVFAVVALPARFLSVARLEEFLAAEIRDQEGDLVARDTDGCLLLLQGARPGQVEAFLDRVRTRLGSDLPEGRAGVSWACSPSDRAGVRAILEERMGVGG
ncbi:MAG: ATPase domain-containing protein [Gemmatimonadota bacterium]|jgi:DNA-binding response OmpR family regulator